MAINGINNVNNAASVSHTAMHTFSKTGLSSVPSSIAFGQAGGGAQTESKGWMSWMATPFKSVYNKTCSFGSWMKSWFCSSSPVRSSAGAVDAKAVFKAVLADDKSTKEAIAVAFKNLPQADQDKVAYAMWLEDGSKATDAAFGVNVITGDGAARRAEVKKAVERFEISTELQAFAKVMSDTNLSDEQVAVKASQLSAQSLKAIGGQVWLDSGAPATGLNGEALFKASPRHFAATSFAKTLTAVAC